MFLFKKKKHNNLLKKNKALYTFPLQKPKISFESVSKYSNRVQKHQN